MYSLKVEPWSFPLSLSPFALAPFFTKGGDRDEIGKIPESTICDKVGCKIVFGVGGGKVQSSSWLIENQQDG